MFGTFVSDLLTSFCDSVSCIGHGFLNRLITLPVVFGIFVFGFLFSFFLIRGGCTEPRSFSWNGVHAVDLSDSGAVQIITVHDNRVGNHTIVVRHIWYSIWDFC